MGLLLWLPAEVSRRRTSMNSPGPGTTWSAAGGGPACPKPRRVSCRGRNIPGHQL